MADRQRRNVNWCVADENGSPYDDMRDGVVVAVLLDIREELRSIHRILQCRNIQGMALAAQRIDKRLATKLPLKTRAKR